MLQTHASLGRALVVRARKVGGTAVDALVTEMGEEKRPEAAAPRRGES